MPGFSNAYEKANLAVAVSIIKAQPFVSCNESTSQPVRVRNFRTFDKRNSKKKQENVVESVVAWGSTVIK